MIFKCKTNNTLSTLILSPGLQSNDEDGNKHPSDKGQRRNRKEDINVISRNLDPKSNGSDQVITRRMDSNSEPADYEYDDEDYADKYVLETEKPEPEYYYYYYYDYMDSGIDISHELTTYEPLPSPLPLGDSVDGQKVQSESATDGKDNAVKS